MAHRCLPHVIFLLICGVLVQACAAESSAGELSKSVESIQSMCKSKLGIGIVELGLLAQAKRGAVFSESGLRGENRLHALDNLSAQGYVQVFRRPAADETWVEFMPTEKGQAVIDSLKKSGSD